MLGLAERYAETYSIEGGALQGQWTSFAFQLADALNAVTGQTWTPDHPTEAHSASNYASYSLVREDGFRLRISRHGKQGVASMEAPRKRAHVVHGRAAPLPITKRRVPHAFDPFGSVAGVAAEIQTHVIQPNEADFARLRTAENRRSETADRLAKASAALAEITGPSVSDPRDEDGRSHLLQDGSVFGRIRLSRGGSCSLEINGVDHETAIAIAALVKARQATAA